MKKYVWQRAITRTIILLENILCCTQLCVSVGGSYRVHGHVKQCQVHYTIPLEALFLMITNSTVTVPTIPEISPTTTPPATPPTPTAVHEVDEHSTTTGRVNSNPSVKNHKLLILGYAQNVVVV